MLTNLNKTEQRLVEEDERLAKLVAKAEKAGAKSITDRVRDATKDAKDTMKAFEDKDAKKHGLAGLKLFETSYKESAA